MMHRLVQSFGRDLLGKKEDVTNPKTMPLDKLVQKIEQKVLIYYLNQVFSFLPSIKKDLWFPEISQELDAFLVRIVRDEENLRSVLDILDERSRELAEGILEGMRENENLYRLNYTYESSKFNKNTLVYRKVYIDKAVEIQRCKVSPPKIIPPTGEVKLKGQWISAILRFAQDNDMDTLEYPEMTLTEAEAIAACITMKNPDVRLKVLWEAVNACKENYELKMSYLHLGCEKVRLTVEKAPLNNNIKVIEKRENKDKGLTKTQRNFQKKKELVSSLGTGFIKAALQMILDFVNNDSETTLVFKNGNEDQCAFIHSACSMAKNKRMYVLFEEQEKVYLRKIAAVLNNLKSNNCFELKADVMRTDRDTKLRNVLLIKESKSEGQKIGNSDPDGVLDISQESSESMDCSNPEEFNVPDTEIEQTRKILTKEEIEKKLQTVNSKVKPMDFTKATNPYNTLNTDKNEDINTIFNPKEVLAKIIELAEPIDEEKISTQTSSSSGKSPTIDKIKTVDKAQAVESVKAVNNKPKPSTSLLTQTFTATKPTTKFISKTVDTSKTTDNSMVTNSKVVNYKITLGNPTIDFADKVINNPLGLDYAKAIDQAKNIGKVHKETLNKMEIDKVTVKTYIKPNSADKHVSKAKAGEGAKMTEKNKNTEAANALAKAVDKEYGKPIENKEANKVPKEQSDGRPLPVRKAKLLEAMSVPMDSPMAMRMMRQMGWEGGPLGTRGEGITEPILPALHITTGAGLGHIKPKKEPPAKCKNYRLDILTHIHLLILEEPLRRTALYPNQISKKERGFLLHAVKAFNRRSFLQMNDEELQGLVRLIMDEMTKEPRLQISAALHEDKRTITLSKNEIQRLASPPANPPRLPPAPPPEGVLPVLARHAKSAFITGDTVAAVGQALMPGVVGKTAKALGHKVVLLSKVLELVKSSTCHKNLTFQYTLTLKQVNFLKELLVNINLRSKVSYSVYENYLVGEILKIADDTVFLTHEFGSTNQSMTLFKKSSQYQKRFSNSAKEEQTNKDDPADENEKKSKEIDKETEKIDVKDVKAAIDNEVSVAKDVNDACDKLNDLKLAKDNVQDMEIEECDSKVVGDVIGSDKATDASTAKDVILSDSIGNDSVKKDATDNVEVIKTDEKIDRKGNTTKRIRTDSDDVDAYRKKSKSQIPKFLCIAPDSYPIDEVDFDIICTFQNLICDKLEKNTEKPYLECVGLKNGALIYGCHNEYGRILIESVARELDLKTTNITNLYKDRKRYKVTGRMNTYLDINLKKLFSDLEEYNEGLKTDAWNVVDEKKNKGNIELLIDVDFNSFDYISQHGFGLYAGLDKVRFSVVWE